MKLRTLRIVCVALLYSLSHLFTPGCSSSQEEDADLEASEQGVDQEEGEGQANAEGNNEAVEGEEQADASQEGNEEVVENAEGEEGEEEVAEEGAEDQLLEGDQTTNDLQEIIAGQNANQGEANANAAPAETAEEVPVEDATADTVAAADAAPAAEGSEAIPQADAPPAATAGNELPEMHSKMPYIVRANDTVAKIAQQIYGDASRWQEIATLSSLKNPNHVRPGDVVYYKLDEKSLAFATAYEKAARMEVKVQTGDTLSAIAERVYGSPLDWKFIWRQNGDIQNPDRIEVGQTLVYLAPTTLSSAIDYAKSIKIADLIKMNFDKVDPQSNTQTGSADVSVDQVNGFQIAADMFNVLASNFAG